MLIDSHYGLYSVDQYRVSIDTAIMGQSLAVLRAQENMQAESAKEKLAMLEKMAHAQLASKVNTILHGSSDDEEIHKGKVVAKYQQIYCDASSKPGQVDSAIGDFFEGDLLDGAKKLVLAGVDELLGNTSVGENEAEDMLILWESNALLRVDVYYWKWNFSSKGVIDVAQNIFAMYCVKRVINPSEVDPNVLVWAITRMCLKKGMENDEALDYIEKIMEKLREVEKYIALPPPSA